MNTLSAAIVVLAGVVLTLGSALFAHDHTALLVRACGLLLSGTGALGWLAMIWFYCMSGRMAAGGKS